MWINLTDGFCGNVNLIALLNLLSLHTEPNMDRYACSMATDMMMAYYKVSAAEDRLRNSNEKLGGTEEGRR